VHFLTPQIDWLNFAWPFLAAFFLALLFVPVVRWVAVKVGALDYPSKIKIHKKPIPRLGGVAIFLAFVLVVIFDLLWGHHLVGKIIELKHVIGLLLGCLVIVVTGIIDDVRGLKPAYKFLGQIVAVLVVIFSGIGIDFLTSPFGTHFDLKSVQIPISFSESTFKLVLFADLFAFLWILGMINTVNFLDGLDGLAGGIGLIAALVLFLISLRPEVNQKEVAFLAVTFAGAILGFLVFNFHPAKIFAGDSGSLLIGFVLAVLAIINGAKIATALLIMGFPILDVLWAIIRRVIKGQSPFKGDKRHFHHRLLELGLNQWQAVLVFYFFGISFGLAAFLTRTSWSKMVALIILVALMVATFTLVLARIQLRQRRIRLKRS
jgi:UDP-GlcNAc:undecaprenyl-phosphate GlcNAc-1-phosphate transferase